MHDSMHAGMTSDGASTTGEFSSHSTTPSSYSSPTNGRSSHVGHNSSSSVFSTRATSSGSSDDSVSSRGRDQLSLYETHIARQLLVLKEGIPSDIIAPRRQRQFTDDTRKDAVYWERRRKNNEAAKRSREKRRINDMAMESQISKIQQEMDMMRSELVTLKSHYGLDLDEPFIPPHSIATDQSVPSSVTCSMTGPSSHISLPPPATHHLPLMVGPHEPSRRVVHMPRLLRPMLHMPLHPASMQVVPRHVSPNPANSRSSRPPTPYPPSSNDEGKSHWIPERIPTDTGTELAYRKDDHVVERTAEYRSAEDSYHPSDESANGSKQSAHPDEQDSPLNLVVKTEKSNKETSEELSLRMHVEAARRYEEIKAGSVDHCAEANRDSGVISPSGSTSSTSSGSPYSKRLRVDESDSLMEAESISTGSENTSSEVLSSNRCVIDNNKYVERRKRNNEASRRSRENRKYIAKTREEKTDVLEMENSKLRQELNSLASEVSNLKDLIVAKHGKSLESDDTTDARKTRAVPVSVSH